MSILLSFQPINHARNFVVQNSVTSCLKPHITSHSRATSEATTSTARPLTANSLRTRASSSMSLSTASGGPRHRPVYLRSLQEPQQCQCAFRGAQCSRCNNRFTGVSHFHNFTVVIYPKSPQNHSISQIFTIQITSYFQSCFSVG